MEIVSNVKVYGLENSIRAAKFPMATDFENLTAEKTKSTDSLGKAKIGSGHDNFLNGIIVQFDLTFSNKAWVEMQRYHFIDFISSGSTMHRITKFDLKEACNEYVDERIIKILQEKVDKYNNGEKTSEKYLEILYNIPSGFRMTAAMTTNYRQLKTIYHQRKNHRLPEWREFCKWIETLPEHEWITDCN